MQYKLYGYIKNKNVERVVASAVLRAQDIPDQFVKMYVGGQDIAQVMSMNHYPWVHSPRPRPGLRIVQLPMG